MSTISEIKNNERIITLFEESLGKDVGVQLPIINNPVGSKKNSKFFAKNLTMNSAVKAGLVFVSTVLVYYTFKTTRIFSYFKFRAGSPKML